VAPVAAVAPVQGAASTIKEVVLVHPVLGKVLRTKVRTILPARRVIISSRNMRISPPDLPRHPFPPYSVEPADGGRDRGRGRGRGRGDRGGSRGGRREYDRHSATGKTYAPSLRLSDQGIYPKPLSVTRTRRSTNLGVVMKARQSSRLRLLLPTMPLLKKSPPPPKNGEPVQVAMTGLLKVVILNGVLKAATPSGVLRVVTLTGLLLPLPPPRMPKSLPSGLTDVLGIVKRRNQIIR